VTEAILEQVRRLFDYWAEGGYAEAMERDYWPVARHAFEKLQLRPRQRFLDIGCGNGYACRWAVEAQAMAFGIDGSPRMIERAKRAAAGIEGLDFRRGFFPADFIKPKAYDAIFAMESMYYMPDVPAALKAVYDAMVPGGTFANVVSYYWENQASHDWPRQSGVPMTMATEAQWGEAVSATGMVVMRQEKIFNGPGAGSLLILARKPAG
jgi:SAM-dependent methyltransferase